MPDNQPGYPRFRRRDIPRHAKVVLVRGDAEDPEIDRGQAQDFLDKYPRWGRFGLSAYYARGRRGHRRPRLRRARTLRSPPPLPPRETRRASAFTSGTVPSVINTLYVKETVPGLPSYLRSGLCGDGTPYKCPGRDVPIRLPHNPPGATLER